MQPNTLSSFSERTLRHALAMTGMGVWQRDLRTNRSVRTSNIDAMFGFAPGEVGEDAAPFQARLHPEDRAEMDRRIAEATATGATMAQDFRVILPDGSVRWLSSRGEVVRDSDGRPGRILSVIMDITERRRAEGALRASEARLQLALDAARLGTYERDLRTNRGLFSPAGAALHGLPPDDPGYTPQSWLQTIHPEDRARVAATMQQAIEGRNQYEADYRVVWPDGQMRWVAARGEIAKDETGRPIRAAGIVYDITDRKQAEEALRANEQWLRLAMDAARVGAWSWSAATGRFTFSDWLCELFAIPRGLDIARDELRRLRVHPDDYERAGTAFEVALAERRDYDVEYRIVRPYGPLLWVRAMGRGEYDAEGTATGMIGIIQDITERKRAEQALRDNETRLRVITDSVPGAITYIDAEMRYGFVNAVFEDWLALRRENVIGRRVADVLDELNYRTMRPWAERALAGEDVVFERTLEQPGRARRHLLVRFFPDRGEGAQVRGFYTLAIDITDRKEGEERLKLLAAEVDHRAKNMLALVQIMLRQTRADSVKAFANAAQGRVTALARAHALLSEQRWVGADLARIVQDELAPYRIQDRQRVLIDGPPVALSARAAQSCALALHELTTNAAKYGSLSTAEGRVECTWRRVDGDAVLSWRERGGPAVQLPEHRGFGMNVIERSIADQLGGAVRFEWRREGLVCTLTLPAQGAPG